jgi:hypothetical protein
MRFRAVLAAVVGIVVCGCSGKVATLPDTEVRQSMLREGGFDRAVREARQIDLDARELLDVGNREGWNEDLASRLDESDLLLNQSLRLAYRKARPALAERPSNDLLRVASLHWIVATRRLVQDALHTQVAGLESDPDCAGDLVVDALMLRYVDAVLEQAVENREARVVSALSDLARQAACISTQQSNLYATALVSAFDEVAIVLRTNGQEETIPLLAAVASQPMILFYDVEKWRGPTAPLSLWYSNYREILRQVIQASRHPSQWAPALALRSTHRDAGRLQARTQPEG